MVGKKVLYGGWAALPTSLSVEAFVRAGFDFVTIDVQHGAFGLERAQAAVQLLDSLGVESLIRISISEFHQAAHFLDFGATGVIVAMVGDAATVRDAINATRYQPRGYRSYAGQRFGFKHEPAHSADVMPKVFGMIETAAGIRQVEAIAAVPELSGLFVGPADLALALGIEPGVARERIEWQATVESIRTAAASNHISAGIVAADGADAAHWAAAGFDRVVVGSDIGLLQASMSAELTKAGGRSQAISKRAD